MLSTTKTLLLTLVNSLVTFLKFEPVLFLVGLILILFVFGIIRKLIAY